MRADCDARQTRLIQRIRCVGRRQRRIAGAPRSGAGSRYIGSTRPQRDGGLRDDRRPVGTRRWGPGCEGGVSSAVGRWGLPSCSVARFLAPASRTGGGPPAGGIGGTEVAAPTFGIDPGRRGHSRRAGRPEDCSGGDRRDRAQSRTTFAQQPPVRRPRELAVILLERGPVAVGAGLRLPPDWMNACIPPTPPRWATAR